MASACRFDVELYLLLLELGLDPQSVDRDGLCFMQRLEEMKSSRQPGTDFDLRFADYLAVVQAYENRQRLRQLMRGGANRAESVS